MDVKPWISDRAKATTASYCGDEGEGTNSAYSNFIWKTKEKWKHSPNIQVKTFKSNLKKKLKFKKKLNGAGPGRYENLSYLSRLVLSCLALFNFLNGTGMWIILNKRGGVGMGVTRPEPAPLPSLVRIYIVRGTEII